MKKVRFETPRQSTMEDTECHSPRPYISKQIESSKIWHEYPKALQYSSDPIERYESSNCSPYPLLKKTNIHCGPYKYQPSGELDLSMVDSSHCGIRKTLTLHTTTPVPTSNQDYGRPEQNQVLSSVENKILVPPNVLNKDDAFFITRDHLLKGIDIQKNLNIIGKENEPRNRKAELIRNFRYPTITIEKGGPVCDENSENMLNSCNQIENKSTKQFHHRNSCQTHNEMLCQQFACFKPFVCNACSHCVNQAPQLSSCNCLCTAKPPQNIVDKKMCALKKIECEKNMCNDIEKQPNVTKEKREPTVADLFKIIKLQNEQLQLLQERVDMFLSSKQQMIQNEPIQHSNSDNSSLKNVNSQHKISIGVMTSFEMVHTATSTIINKEIVTQTKENAHIQCNRSQISIKEVISKAQPTNLNFLDGIIPMDKALQEQRTNTECSVHENDVILNDNEKLKNDNFIEERTLNEVSLYNIHVDNAITPLMSPEQSLYLDVRDYSDSESSDDQSNVGWTYYNKVMNHVNGMLQDSDMPSSASALYRNTRQKCLQMQIDKTNISVTKRVKFGDDPLGLLQPHLQTANSDTSLKMNQLAAKYLKNGKSPVLQVPTSTPAAMPVDLSYATRNYMERHKLLQGIPPKQVIPAVPESIPRFLDITALKQQPKLI